MAVHCDQQRAEFFDAKFPQRLGVQVVEIDVLDLLDPCRLQRRSAANNGEIHATDVLERGLRCGKQPAFTYHDAHAVLLHQRAREALHARAGRGAYADRLVTGRMRHGLAHPPDVGCGMDHRVALEVEARRAATVEHVDERRITDAEKRLVQRDGIVDLQFAHVGFGHRHVEIVVGHISNPIRRKGAKTQRERKDFGFACT